MKVLFSSCRADLDRPLLSIHTEVPDEEQPGPICEDDGGASLTRHSNCLLISRSILDYNLSKNSFSMS